MTLERDSDEDRALERALAELPEPELPAALRERLMAIPARGRVRRFPVRSWRASALGWAAAAAVGLFIGARSVDQEAVENAMLETVTAESAPADAASADEDEAVALAVGSFTGLEEEP
jgi:hypothetical protein